jgi:hypothetical protein
MRKELKDYLDKLGHKPGDDEYYDAWATFLKTELNDDCIERRFKVMLKRAGVMWLAEAYKDITVLLTQGKNALLKYIIKDCVPPVTEEYMLKNMDTLEGKKFIAWLKQMVEDEIRSRDNRRSPNV